MQISDLDTVIRKCLYSLFDEISSPDWRGREREMVSRFCFGYLIHSCDPEQIGIEVAVPQLSRNELLYCDPKRNPESNPKNDVCKDVVIWPRRKMTAFNADWKPDREPQAILEWTAINPSDGKKSKISNHEYDQRWLRKKAEIVKSFVGYAVLINTTPGTKQLTCVRVSDDGLIPNWIALGTLNSS